MRQIPLWVPKPVKVMRPRVEYAGTKPFRLWTLFTHTDQMCPPQLPFTPVHRENAFLEDYVHDWTIQDDVIVYASRVSDGDVWILLEVPDTQPPEVDLPLIVYVALTAGRVVSIESRTPMNISDVVSQAVKRFTDASANLGEFMEVWTIDGISDPPDPYLAHIGKGMSSKADVSSS
jgi:hypothetical protein